jgi:hypothetical protein
LEASSVLRVDKEAMILALHDHPDLAEKFLAELLTRNLELEADLCDQLFNQSESGWPGFFLN